MTTTTETPASLTRQHQKFRELMGNAYRDPVVFRQSSLDLFGITMGEIIETESAYKGPGDCKNDMGATIRLGDWWAMVRHTAPYHKGSVVSVGPLMQMLSAYASHIKGHGAGFNEALYPNVISGMLGTLGDVGSRACTDGHVTTSQNFHDFMESEKSDSVLRPYARAMTWERMASLVKFMTEQARNNSNAAEALTWFRAIDNWLGVMPQWMLAKVGALYVPEVCVELDAANVSQDVRILAGWLMANKPIMLGSYAADGRIYCTPMNLDDNQRARLFSLAQEAGFMVTNDQVGLIPKIVLNHDADPISSDITDEDLRRDNGCGIFGYKMSCRVIWRHLNRRIAIVEED